MYANPLLGCRAPQAAGENDDLDRVVVDDAVPIDARLTGGDVAAVIADADRRPRCASGPRKMAVALGVEFLAAIFLGHDQIDRILRDGGGRLARRSGCRWRSAHEPLEHAGHRLIPKKVAGSQIRTANAANMAMAMMRYSITNPRPALCAWHSRPSPQCHPWRTFGTP